MNDNISDKDKKDWQAFISSKEEIVDKDFKPQITNHLKVRSLDLHGYTLEQANNSIEKFILKAFEEGVSKLIIINPKHTGLFATLFIPGWGKFDLSLYWDNECPDKKM